MSCASLTVMPPNFAFHRWNVLAEIPSRRASCAALSPASTSLMKPIICASVNLLFRAMRVLLVYRSDSQNQWPSFRGAGHCTSVGSPSPQRNHSYIWCGDQICLEVDNLNRQAVPNSTLVMGVPDVLYVAQGQVNDPTSWPESWTSPYPAAQLAYDIVDMLGTERAVVTNNAIVAQYAYDTFGNRSTVTGSDTASNRGFAGLYYHDWSGLQFARNRAYSAEVARWVTRDPIGNRFAFADPPRFNGTNLNLNVYVDNNPQSMVDRTGNYGVAGAIAGAISGAIGGYITGGTWESAVFLAAPLEDS